MTSFQAVECSKRTLNVEPENNGCFWSCISNQTGVAADVLREVCGHEIGVPADVCNPAFQQALKSNALDLWDMRVEIFLSQFCDRHGEAVAVSEPFLILNENGTMVLRILHDGYLDENGNLEGHYQRLV